LKKELSEKALKDVSLEQKKQVVDAPRPKSIDRYSDVYEDEEKIPDALLQEKSPQ